MLTQDGYNEIVYVDDLSTIIIGWIKQKELKREILTRGIDQYSNIDTDPQLEAIDVRQLKIIDCSTGTIESEGYSPWIFKSIGDIDGDGINEIIFTEARDGVTFHILDAVTKNEEGIFSIPNTSISYGYLFLGDINSDGAQEIFYGTDGGNQEDRDYIINGTTYEIIWEGQTEWRPKVIMDIDGDGQLEVIDSMHVYNLDTKEVEWELPGVPGAGGFIDIKDVDSDGTLEIIRGTDNTSWQSDGFYLCY